MLYWLVVSNIFCFSIYWEFHHPNWRTHIFQRGCSTTNEYNMLCFRHSSPRGHSWPSGRRLSDLAPAAAHQWSLVTVEPGEISDFCLPKVELHQETGRKGFPWWVICSGDVRKKIGLSPIGHDFEAEVSNFSIQLEVNKIE